MATRLSVLVIGWVAIAGCVGERPMADPPASDAGIAHAVRSGSRAKSSPTVRTLTDAGVARQQSDASAPRASDEAIPGELDTQTINDDDAGVAELAEDIALDCRESLRCEPRGAGNLPDCVVTVSEALGAASAEARARFRALVMRCRALRGCGYVSCVAGDAPARP